MSVVTDDYPIDAVAFGANALGWLAARATELGTPYLLAFADNGVIWGLFDGQTPATTGVELGWKTLQAARLFGQERELAVWREGERFVGRLTHDQNGQSDEADNTIQETYWLWGMAEQNGQRFTPMVEGRQGLRHAPPLALAPGQRAGLIVRHYLAEDDDGAAFIAHSRLVGLTTV